MATGKKRKRLITGFGVAMLAVLGFVIFFRQAFTTVVVSGPSMLPTFQSGERLLASSAYWLVGDIKRKDIVVVRDPNASGYIIKRVAFMPGEKVDFYNIPKTARLSDGPYIVPNDSYYLLGDNRAVSEDSRVFGPVKRSDIIGKIVIRP
jgi:signal peptidase I